MFGAYVVFAMLFSLYIWPRLFEGWITLSTQWISVNKTNNATHWIVIYPVDSIIHPLNNPGLMYSLPITQTLQKSTPDVKKVFQSLNKYLMQIL